ncbi:dynamin family protein [Oceanobacillus salinisoli]|uniref:dynamin family protein n=1 Tax=Oceanobacillus salinisoli TaxID=2678611 RepID=UPI0012E0F552|nr:dynamin family protein [Oceanobacillus salinisoli]
MNSLNLKTESIEIKLEHLADLYKLILQNEDRPNAEKILDLYEKLDQKEFMISFAGHFSAGKSSMINALMGEDILPKSPIPTSANIVKITSGGGYARAHLHNGEILQFNEPYDMDMIKEYSKNKDDIKKIEISTAKRILPAQCALMDTPGIDAADDADRIMTESSLHLIDVLFYVMDYNHVQSEVNLQFLKSIQSKAIPFYVIVNQIDKHDEDELSFEQFKRSITHTFHQWNIRPEAIFYSSLIDEKAKYNQFEEIQKTLFHMLNRDTNLSISIHHSLHQVITSHKKFLKNTYEAKLGPGTDDQELEESLQKIEDIESHLKELEQKVMHFENDFHQEMQSTLNNAYIMPAVLRDKAHAFLESQQSNFKVGLLASRKKTRLEKEHRLEAFLTALQENIEAAIRWKLRDKFVQLAKQYDLTDEALVKQIQSLSLTYGEADLITLIKPGAKVNGDYVLHYTKDVSNDIKIKFKQMANQLLGAIKQYLTEKNKQKELEYKKQLSQLEFARDYKQKKEDIEKELNAKIRHLDAVLEHPAPTESDWEQMETARNEIQKRIKQADVPEKLEKKAEQTITIHTKQEGKAETIGTNPSVEQVIKSIEKTIHAVDDLPGFEELQSDLVDKTKRLSNRTYTIALFGAFSAGKSSFANALIGESALPVSPNPTTAAVNRICPVSDTYKHGTVVVTWKDERTLANDLYMITKKLTPTATEFLPLLQWVKENNIHQSSKLNKMYQAYLQALINGYDNIKNSIGEQRTITLDEFSTYVTDETKACYISSINLYYDCSLTRQGITLVDTPGADSVNARHTNVAFEYIKHADAILYVTYYNHALSRADRDFLMQLGRVKEAFQLDKMFFIVNAADLAHNEEELSLVVHYVQEQLQELGVRLPRLYPVSSKRSLKEKQSQQILNEQMFTFEENFYHFIHDDLARLTTDSALWDMRRTYNKLTNFIDSMSLDETAKEKRKQDLYDKIEKLRSQLVNIETSIYDERIHDKMDKQLFYVLERLQIRFHDIFKEHFNPTTITESGRKGYGQLRSNVENLMEYVGFELRQELQAVSLRLEAFIQQQGKEFYQSIEQRCINIDTLFELPNWQPTKMETPEYKEAFTPIDMSIFDKVITSFKGTKAFFEKNEKEQMKEQIFSLISPLAKEYMEENKRLMYEEYLKQWRNLVDEMKESAIKTTNQYVKNYEEMIGSRLNLPVLEKKQQFIQTELQKHGIEEVS